MGAFSLIVVINLLNSIVMSRKSARIYVGNLPPDIRVSDIKELFDSRKYGKILDVDLKNEKGPPFAFVEFENQDEATVAASPETEVVAVAAGEAWSPDHPSSECQYLDCQNQDLGKI